MKILMLDGDNWKVKRCSARGLLRRIRRCLSRGVPVAAVFARSGRLVIEASRHDCGEDLLGLRVSDGRNGRWTQEYRPIHGGRDAYFVCQPSHNEYGQPPSEVPQKK